MNVAGERGGTATARSRKTNSSPGSVGEEFLNPALEPVAAQPERPVLLSRLSAFLPGILDGFSSSFFHLSFSNLTYLFSSWWSRL
jgi:hypothetical protein